MGHVANNEVYSKVYLRQTPLKADQSERIG